MSRSSRIGPALAVAAWLTATGHGAHGQGGQPNRDEAAALADAAYDFYRRGMYADALALFRRADERAHSPVFVLYMGRAEERAGRLSEAQAHYHRAANEALAADAPAAHHEAQRAAREELARLEGSLQAARPAPPLAPAPERASPSTEAQPDQAEPAAFDGQLAAGIAALTVGVGALVTFNVGFATVTSIGDDPAYVHYREGFPETADVCDAAREGRVSPSVGASTPAEAAALCDEADAFEIVEAVTAPVSIALMALGVTLLVRSPTVDSTDERPAVSLTLTPGRVVASGPF